MIVLELIQLLALVAFITISFAWICLKDKKDTVPKTPADHNIVSFASEPEQKHSESDHEIKKQTENSSSIAQVHREQPNLTNYDQKVVEFVSSGDPIVYFDSENTQLKVEPDEHLLSPPVNTPSNKEKNLQEIVEINSILEENSEVVPKQDVSECEKIEVKETSKKKREKKRLAEVKNHYKKIIQSLQAKLEQVCIRNNESISMINPDETINISADESLISYEENGNGTNDYFLEMQVEEIKNLKDEIQFHEEMVTALIEEDGELKERIKLLQSENQRLKESGQQPLVQSKVQINMRENLSDLKQVKKELNAEVEVKSQLVQKQLQTGIQKQTLSQAEKQKLLTPESQEKAVRSQQVSRLQPNEGQQIRQPISFVKKRDESHIKNLYTSQIIFPFKQSPLFSSRIVENPSSVSTISIMSIVQGAISIGLLGECRFMNQISKKFTISQIRKVLKKRIVDSQLIYSQNENQQNQKDFVSAIKEKGNLLVLIKCTNGKCIASFVERPILFEDQGLEKEKGHILFMDLSKRKVIASSKGSCFCTGEGLVWGNKQFILKDSKPIAVTSQNFGGLISNNQKALQLFGSQKSEATVEYLEIFMLHPSQ